MPDDLDLSGAAAPESLGDADADLRQQRTEMAMPPTSRMSAGAFAARTPVPVSPVPTPAPQPAPSDAPSYSTPNAWRRMQNIAPPAPPAPPAPQVDQTPQPSALVSQPSQPQAPDAPAPSDDPQSNYATARQRAGQSIIDTQQRLADLGFPAPPTDSLADPAALQNHVQNSLNAALASPQAQSPQVRQNLQSIGQQAAAAVNDHAAVLGDLRNSYAALQQAQQPAQQPPPIPGLDDTDSTQQQGEGASSGAHNAASPGATPGPATPFQPTDAPYRKEADGTLTFDPSRLSDGLMAAYKSGDIDTDKFKTLLPKAIDSERALQERQQLVESNPIAAKLMALGHGATTGAAFLAGAAPGAEAGAAIGAPFGGVGAPIGAAIGGAITGGLASWGANKILKKLGEYSSTIDDFNKAAEAHPYFDAAGNLVAFGAGLPKVATDFAAKGLTSLAGEGEGAIAKGLRGAASAYEKGSPGVVQSAQNLAQDWQTRVASGASPLTASAATASRLGGYAGANILVDTAIKQGAKALGLQDEGQTLPGAVQAGLLGAFMAGHGLEVNGVTPEAVTNAVVKRKMGAPLSPLENEIANAFDGELTKAVNEGRIPQNASANDVEHALRATSGRQMTQGGKPYGVTALNIANNPTSFDAVPPGAVSPPGRLGPFQGAGLAQSDQEYPAQQDAHHTSFQPSQETSPSRQNLPSTPGAQPPSSSKTPGSDYGVDSLSYPESSAAPLVQISEKEPRPNSSSSSPNTPVGNVPQDQKQDSQSNGAGEVAQNGPGDNVPRGNSTEAPTAPNAASAPASRESAPPTGSQPQSPGIQGNRESSPASEQGGTPTVSPQDRIAELQRQIADATALQEQAKREGNALAVALHGKELADARNELAVLQSHEQATQTPAQTTPAERELAAPEAAQSGVPASQEPASEQGGAVPAVPGLAPTAPEIPGMPSLSNAETPHQPVTNKTPASPASEPNAETTSNLGDAASSAPLSEPSKATGVSGGNAPAPVARKPLSIPGFPDVELTPEMQKRVRDLKLIATKRALRPAEQRELDVLDPQPAPSAAPQQPLSNPEQPGNVAPAHHEQPQTTSETQRQGDESAGRQPAENEVRSGNGSVDGGRNGERPGGEPARQAAEPHTLTDASSFIRALKRGKLKNEFARLRTDLHEGDANSPMFVTVGNGERIMFNPKRIAAVMDIVRDRGLEPKKWLHAATEEELIHTRQLTLARGGFLKHYTELWRSLPHPIRALVAKVYVPRDANGKAMSPESVPQVMGAEAERMIIQARSTGAFSELLSGEEGANELLPLLLAPQSDLLEHSIAQVESLTAVPEIPGLETPVAESAQEAKPVAESETAKEESVSDQPVHQVIPGAPKLEYSPASKIDSPALGILNAARERKAILWKQVKSLREQVRAPGLNKSGLRLKLMEVESAHREALRQEEGALKVIEKRANELGKTTIKPARSFNLRGPQDEHFAANPIIQAIGNHGGLLSKASAKAKWSTDKWNDNKGEWDDAPTLSSPTHNHIYKPNGLQPDEMAQALIDEGLLPVGAAPPELWKAIGQASESAARIRKQAAAQQRNEFAAAKQGAAFEKDLHNPKSGDAISADDLKTGDAVTVNGERFKVVGVNEDGVVTLEDGSRYGVQSVEGGDVIYGELDPSQEEAEWPDVESEVDPVKSAGKVTTQEEANATIAKHQLSTENQSEQSVATPSSATPQGGQANTEGKGVARSPEHGGAVGKFSLEKPESVDEQRARMEAAQKKRDEEKAKADMLDKAKAPLKGDAGDLTADMFGGGETPLFNENRAKPEGLFSNQPYSTNDDPERNLKTDAITGAPTQLTGKTVTSKAAGNIAARNERLLREVGRLVEDAQSGGKGGSVGGKPAIEEYGRVVPRLTPETRQKILNLPYDHPTGWNTWERSEGAVVGTGDFAYKIYQPREDGGGKGLGLVGELSRKEGRLRLENVRGGVPDIIEKATVLSHLGVPTEVVGVLPETGEVVTKQPNAPEATAQRRVINELDTMGGVPVPVSAATQFGTWMVNVNGRHYLVTDLRDDNVRNNSQGEARPVDVVIHRVTDEEFAQHPELAEVRGEVRPLESDRLFANEPQEDSGPFYSQLTRTIQSLQQETMTVGQAKAAITKGAKQAEIAQQGIFDDPLSPLAGKQPNDKVSKADLLGYSLERQAKVQDVKLGEYPGTRADYKEARAKADAAHARIVELDRMYGSREWEDREKEWESKYQKEFDQQVAIEDAAKATMQGIINSAPNGGETHFEQYTLPGADEGSYREMFVTWPKEKPIDISQERDAAWAALKAMDDLGFENTAQANRAILQHPDFANRWEIDPDKLPILKAYRDSAERMQAVKGWSDGHGQYRDIANPIVRIRRNIRTDADGKKTYFLEEMQGPSSTNQEKMPPELRKRIYEIGMKRAIRDAIDEGADAIGWTTGEQQAERYDLSKQVDSVIVDRSRTGGYNVSVKPKGSSEWHAVGERGMSASDLENAIGKDLAKQAIDKTSGDESRATFAGDGLKIGGEGLKNLYDTMLPRIANKLAEKAGGKVSKATIGEPDKTNLTGNQWTIDTSTEGSRVQPIHSMDLPEAWKEDAPSFSLYANEPEEKKLSRISATLEKLRTDIGLASLVDDIQKVFSPDDRLTPAERERFIKTGDVRAIGNARKFGILLDGITAETARRKQQWEDSLKEMHGLVAKLPSEQQQELLLRMDEGTPLKPGPYKDAMENLQKIDREHVEDLKNQFDKLGLDHWKNFEHYEQYIIPHQFEDQKAADLALEELMKRRKMQGGTGFLKNRTGIPLRELIASAKEQGIDLKLKHTNPVDAIADRWTQQDRYIGAHKLMQQMEAMGTGHWEDTDYQPKAGEKQVNNIIGQRVAEVPIDRNAPGRKLVPIKDGEGHEIEGTNTHRRKQYFYADEPSAQIINNYLSRGLRASHKWIDNYFVMANALNGAQLGLSAFHGGFVTMEGMVSSFALGLQKALSGDMSGLKNMALAPFSTWSDWKLGGKIRKEMLHPGNFGQQFTDVINAMVAGGFRDGLDSFYKDNNIAKFLQAFRDKKIAPALLRAPMALIEAVAKPIMEHFVPRMKAAAVYKLAEMHLKQDPNITPMELRRRLQEDVRSGNNRFGQMTYDNLHLHKTVKDLLMGMTRSLGWNWGTFSEIGGGLNDWARFAKGAAAAAAGKGTMPRVTNKMAYTLALPMLVGAMGAVLSAMFGQKPKELKDYYFVKTGDLDERGQPIRVSLPSYMKDVFHAANDPLSTVTNKLHPILSTLGDMLRNKDFYGVEIRHAGDPVMKQLLQELGFAAKQFVPFTGRNAQKLHDAKAPPVLQLGGLVGLTQAPASANKSAAQQLADKIAADSRPNKVRTSEEADKTALRGRLIGMMRAGNGQAELSAALQQGKITPRDVTSIRHAASMTPLQYAVTHMSLNDAERVYEKGTAEEKKQLAPIIDAKRGKVIAPMNAWQRMKAA